MSTIKEIAVNVSKKIGYGDSVKKNFGSTMLSASITTTVESEEEAGLAFKQAWEMAHKEIERQAEELRTSRKFDENLGIGTPLDTSKPPDPIMNATAPVCPVHGMQALWKNAGVSKTTGRPYPGFYACPGKNPDGSFCKQRFK